MTTQSAIIANQNFNTESLRTLPNNEEAERSLIGSIMLNNRAYDDVSDFKISKKVPRP